MFILKGLDKFREKAPLFSGMKILLLPIYAFSVMAFNISLLIGINSIPGLLKSSGINAILLSFVPLIGILLILIIGFSLVYQMWAKKELMKAKYGPLAYNHIFPLGFFGVSSILSISIYLFINYWSFSPAFWMDSPLRFLTVSPDIFWLKLILASIFALTGLTMIIRALQTFGLDYMAVVYLYFPEESKIQKHKIYSVLRHPTYAGALMIALGGMFFTLTIYSVIFFIVLLSGFYIHIHFVEEKELLTRFGKSYKEYMKKVPAFFVRLNKIGVLINFLLGKS